MEKFNLKNLKYDIPSGLVVFLVALPLCLGIALASGAPLFSGIIAGIVGGLIVAFFSGSTFSVSGPAAGLTVIVASAISTLGNFEYFLAAVVLAGVIQIILGYLNAGIIGNYVPSSVIKGMLAAIGIILILKQIPHALGYDKDSEGDFAFLQLDGENTFSEIFTAFTHVHWGAIIIASISLLILILWDLPQLKKYAFFKFVPGALIVVIFGVLMNEFYKNNIPSYYLSGLELVKLPVANSAKEFFSFFTFPDFRALSHFNVYLIAVTLALIASIESLLSVEATDKLDPFKRSTPTNRELKAQGIGNIASGLIGGLPVTAVIVRSSANINSGAKSKYSAIIHGIFLLISVVFFASLLNYIPLSCLAAILLVVGYKLAKITLFKSMYKLGWDQFLPFVVTIVAIQFSDLLKGIGIGLLVSIFFILKNNHKNGYEMIVEPLDGVKKYIFKLAQEVTFVNKGNLILHLSEIKVGESVVFDGSNSTTIDLDVLEIIHDFKNTAELKKIKLELINIPEFKGVAGH
jgi:MFS superfamily sulfate permease-like transporter